MITKTVNLDSAYDSLFEEIRAKSNGAIDIHNLEGFYGNIEDIAALDAKFLRLPLDEPLFDIDANTRKIEIPADFRANGISVQRDHLAEVIFFRIARFFDYTDLSTCDIVINWKMGNREGKTTRFIKFNTVMVEPDETKTDCVIFGWPINDIVTDKGGSLQFAVEFFKTDNEGITYRFNTLAANVNIKDGLVIDEEIQPLELKDDILRSLTNSAFGEGDAAVGDVSWTTGEGHGLVAGAGVEGPGGTIISFNPANWQEVINLDTIMNEQEQPASVGINLIAQAFVDNQTSIRYTDNNGNKIEDAFIEVEAARVLVEDRENLDASKVYFVGNGPDAIEATSEQIADTSIDLYMIADLNPNLIYYVQTAEEPIPAYNKASAEQLAAWGTAEQVKLYSKIATIRADEAGSYVIKAQGEKWITIPDPENEENTIEQKIGAGDTKRSDVVIIPAAKGPDSIEIVEADELPDFDPAGENYHIDDTFENVIFIPESGRNIKAVADFENLGAAQFTWQLGTLRNGRYEFSNLSENEAQFKLSNEDVLESAEEGVYRVVIKNFINNTTSEEVASENYTVSKLASPIESADRVWTQYTNTAPNGRDVVVGESVNFYPKNSSMNKRTAKVRVDNIVLANPMDDAQFKFEWERSFDENAMENPQAVAWEVISNEQNLLIDTEAYYRVKVQHVYNGSVYTKILAPFSANAM